MPHGKHIQGSRSSPVPHGKHVHGSRSSPVPHGKHIQGSQSSPVHKEYLFRGPDQPLCRWSAFRGPDQPLYICNMCSGVQINPCVILLCFQGPTSPPAQIKYIPRGSEQPLHKMGNVHVVSDALQLQHYCQCLHTPAKSYIDYTHLIQ